MNQLALCGWLCHREVMEDQQEPELVVLPTQPESLLVEELATRCREIKELAYQYHSRVQTGQVTESNFHLYAAQHASLRDDALTKLNQLEKTPLAQSALFHEMYLAFDRALYLGTETMKELPLPIE